MTTIQNAQKFRTFFSGLVIAAVLAGCGSDLATELTPDKLSGLWERTDMSGESYDGNPLQVRDYETGPIIFNISKDTMKRVIFVGVTQSGICDEPQPYTISGNTVSMARTKKCAAMEYEFTAFDGNKASVRYDAGGGYLKLEFQRIDESKLKTLADEHNARSIQK